MAEQPPLNRSYVISYAANDRDYPVIGLRADPRVAGYRVPEDLSPHPDSKRYPNHVFTGSQPSNGDERVTHIYEILPSPWVPFTRYDDDLGPIQGRRRAVKNEGQQADLTSSTKISYEGREGSAIVSNEIEESWSIKVDEDGNSLFPLKDRDFYDPSRGAVQERRQLFVPTGEEEGTLENVNGVITQTSYEPYNEFLSVKIVQTYKVDGPQLIGKATDNDGQLVTVTTQRKGADGYIPPNPTATRTVEVNREDAESLIERVVDTPEIFTAKTFSVERPDPIPQKFRVAVPLETEQEIVVGDAEVPFLEDGDISRSQEQRNKFLKRVSSTSRDQTVLPQTLLQKATDNDRQEVTITETLQVGNTSEEPSATTTVESEALGDGNYVIRKTEIPEVFGSVVFRKTREDITPQKFKAAQEDSTVEQNIAGTANPNISLGTGEFAKSEQQVNKFVKRVSTTSRTITQVVTLLESILTPEGQIGSRTLTLASGVQTFTPSATLIDANVEALGDGRTVKTETRVPNVFAGKTIRKTKIDLTPEKFKAKQEDTTTEETVSGVITPVITLNEGEFAKSEQQVTEFVKRTSKTSRIVDAASSLDEFVITPQGQLATRKIILAKGTQTLQPSATLVDGSVEALGDGRSVKTEITVPAVFDEKQESKQKPDIVPQEFRASLPDVTISEVKEGKSTSFGSLAIDEVSKTIQRTTEDKIRETKTVRAQGPYQALTDFIVDNDGLVVTRVKTIAKAPQTIVPTATTSGTVQSLGDGFTLKTQDTKQVFDQKTVSKQQSIQIPPKFVDRETEEESIVEAAQTATPASLGTDGFGVIQSTAQRITNFTVRKSKTIRSGQASIVEKQSNNNLQEVTISSEITSSPETDNLSATTEFSRTQSIGGGKYIKETGTVVKLFDGKVLSATKPDTIPEKFRVNAPNKRTEEIVEQSEASQPLLSDNEYSKSEQRLTEFTVQKTTVEREDNFNEVKSQRLEENWGINIPFKEYISTSIPNSPTVEAEGLNDTQHIIREYDPAKLDSELSSFKVEIPSSIDLDLPRVLGDIRVVWQEEKSSSFSEFDGSGLEGRFRSLTQQDDGEVSSTLSLVPRIEIDLEDIWGKNIPAKIHIFFLKKEQLTVSQIRSKSGATSVWPVFKPRSFSTTVYGKSETKSLRSYISRSVQVLDESTFGYQPTKGSKEASSASLIPVSVNIPPCLTGIRQIDQSRELEAASKTINLTYVDIDANGISLPTPNIDKTLEHSIQAEVKFTVPPCIGQQNIPRSGTYLINSSAEPYKFGWFLVRATTIEASVFA